MRTTCFRWGRVFPGLVLGLLCAASASAQPFEVTNLEDSGNGSLRQAIENANTSPGQDEIEFAEGLTGTIELATALPVVTENLDIRARADQSITIKGPASFESFIDVSAGTTEVLDVDLAGGQISIGLNNTFTFNQTRDAEFDQTITDEGKLRKEGGASLTLSGTNDYTGGTEVAAGELIGDAESLQGLITNDAELVFDQSGSGTFNGTIEGEGNVTKRGTGELTFSASNNYGGATTVVDGTLIGNPTSIKNDVSVESGATLDVTTDEQGTMSISGAGTLVKRGAEKLNLTGNNSVATATVELGSLSGEAAAIPDDLTLMPNTTVIFDQQTEAGTQQGSITGFGAVQKDGAESLTLLGNNDYSGRTTVNMGELIGNTNSLPGDITNDANLVFDQSTNGTYENEISGTGDLEKRGSGTLKITKDQVYTGSTTIKAGELSLLDETTRLTATAIVNVGVNGTLSGNGSIFSNVSVEGRLSPGTSVGTLSVSGDVTFESGSVFDVEVEAPDSTDLLVVNGDLNIDLGAGLEVGVNPGEFTPGEPLDFTIATAQNNPNQNNLDILTSLAFLDLTLENSGSTNLVLTVTRNDKTLEDFAQTPNESAVAEGLFPAPTGSPEFDSDFATVEENLTTLSPEEIPSALNAIGGEQLAPFATQRLAIARRFHQAVDSRMNTLYWRDWASFTGNRQAAFAENTRTGAPRASAPGALPAGAMGAALTGTPASSFDYTPRESGLGGWIDAYGVLGSLDGNGNASTVDYQIGGGTIAVDYRFLDHYLVGLAGGYAHTSTELKRLPRDGVANTGQVGVYLGRVTPLYYVDVAGRFGYSSIETNRKIDFGQLNRTAKASFDGLSYGGHVAGGLNVADLAGIVLQPVARFDYVRLHREAISEKGAGSLNLSVPSENLNSIVTQLGARLFGEFEIADGLWFLPNLGVRWMHEFGDTQRAIDARLSGAVTEGAWSVSSVDWPRDTAVIGVGWTITTRNRFQIYIDYDATIGSGVFENGFGGGARIVW